MTKDQKGYERRPMDRQDKIVLWGCALTVVAMVLIGVLS